MTIGTGRRKLVLNAAVLTAVSLLLRTAGMSYRVHMTERVGTEGIGLYTLTQTAFLFAVTLATAGLSTAVTRVVSEDIGAGRENRRVLPRALCYAVPLGTLAGALLFFGADPIGAHFLADARTALPLRILAPALPVMSAAAVLKGYFYARRDAALPAVSDVLEQGVEMAVFFALAGRWAPRGVAWGCAAIVTGTTASELASLVFLAAAYRLRRHREAARGEPVLPRLLRIALPVSGSACLGAGLRTVENTLIPRGLEAHGASHARALELYGLVRGMALPLIFYPAAFVSAFASLLIPELAEARAAGRVRSLHGAIRRVIQCALLLSILVAGLLAAFPSELARLVYRNEEVGRVLLILAPLTPFMYLDSIVDGMLKGLDEQSAVLRYNLFDSAVRVAMVRFLIPYSGFFGFMLVMYVSNITNPFLSLRRLWRVTGIRPSRAEWVYKPVFCAAAAAVGGRLLAAAGLARSAAGLVACIAVFCVLYLSLLFATAALGEGDLRFFRRFFSGVRAKPYKTS
ncbi:MAG: polysaccharide biosynthesis C-terminal domain-containing protein [Clostridiales bacterium]|nr:polysaccharide biosynthesis C-terminal domain-containing protein [Clostridiales bacterium]